jgi:hypothetical protein
MQYNTANSGAGIVAIGMALTQAGANVNGTWTTGGASGTVTGTTTIGGFSGTFTFNATSVTGSACTGTLAVSGTETLTTLRWTSPFVTGNCSNLPTDIVIAAQLR